MNIYINDTTMINILNERLPGCTINNSDEYDLILINIDYVEDMFRIMRMPSKCTYFYVTQELENTQFMTDFINKILKFADYLGQEYISNNTTDSIINM